MVDTKPSIHASNKSRQSCPLYLMACASILSRKLGRVEHGGRQEPAAPFLRRRGEINCDQPIPNSASPQFGQDLPVSDRDLITVNYADTDLPIYPGGMAPQIGLVSHLSRVNTVACLSLSGYVEKATACPFRHPTQIKLPGEPRAIQ